MCQRLSRIACGRKGPVAFALLWIALPWPFARARGEEKVVSPDQAIAVIEQLGARIERAQWTYTCFNGRLTDPLDRNTATFKTDAPYKSTIILEVLSGRYRHDEVGVLRWLDGPAPYIGCRHQYAFDGQRQLEYVLEKPGTEVPKPGDATGRGTISGEHRDEFLKKCGGSSSGVSYFPPNFNEKKLSDLLRGRIERKSPLRIAEDAKGQWTITTDQQHRLEGVLLQIFYDPTRGIVTGARLADDEMGKPGKVWSEWYFDHVRTDNDFWVPRQVDCVNLHDRTIYRGLYSDVKVNQPVEDSVFTFTFPLGTQVTDDLEQKRYLVGEGAVNDEKATLAYAQLHGLRMTETVSPPADSSRKVLLVIATVVGVVLLLAGLWTWRRKFLRRGALLLLAACVPPAAHAAELSERGEWTVQHGNTKVSLSQCGTNVTILTLACFGIHYDLRQLAEALPPTREGISFADVQTFLEANGLRCVARQGVSLAELCAALRPGTMALFAAQGPGGYHHYFAAIHHPDKGCLLLDPPRRPPIPLAEAAAHPHLQPLSGLVLFVGRDEAPVRQASRVTVAPSIVELGRFSTTDSEASIPRRHQVIATNTSDHPVLVSRIPSACGCIRSEWSGGVLRPGESRAISFVIVRGAWGQGEQVKQTPLLFADNSMAGITWKGEGVVDPAVLQRLQLSSDTIRIDLDALSSNASLEKTVRVWLSGPEAVGPQVSCDVPWLAAEFERENSQAGRMHVRVFIGEELRREEHVEGKVLLAAVKGQAPAAINVILSRKVPWQAAPPLVTVSRRSGEPQQVDVVPRDGVHRVVKGLRLVDPPGGLALETSVRPSGSAAVSVRVPSSAAPGLHALKVGVTDDRGTTATVSFLVRVVE